jgi:hypothetical protein
MDDLDAGVACQIDPDGLFAAVVHVKLKVIVADIAFNLWRPTIAAHRVTAQWFNFDNPRAHVGKYRAGAWCCHPAVNFNDGNVVQG